MSDEKRITRFDMWFLRAMWIGLLGAIAALTVWIASFAITIAMAGGEGTGLKAGVLLALAAVLLATLVWAAISTPRQWREFIDRAEAGPSGVAATRWRSRMIDWLGIGWLRDTWRDTDPANDTVPTAAELPDDDRLRAVGLDDDAIKRLRANPRIFPQTLRRLGFSSFGGVRGEGCAARTVGAAHLMWSRLA